MILAAGLGTRLRPLTDNRPKALVEVAARTLLEITLERLQRFGIREVIVNVHHCADMVEKYLQAHDNFGMRIEISREDDLLDTGGGLKKAGYFFSDTDEPFILHNVDVISTIDLELMVQRHNATQALATLGVQERKTSRYLLFDEHLELCGRRLGTEDEIVKPTAQVVPLAFSGIHIISPRLLRILSEEGAFSIVSSYLRLAASGEKIGGFRTDQYYWLDLGKPENIARAEQDIKANVCSM
jgi:NDP-sugar pyrophosphorylase family protein